MSFLQNIWQDLVEKRLVPVLAALVIALVAVPIVLGGGGADPADAPLPVATVDDGVVSGTPVVSADTSTRLESQGRKLLNPFSQQHVPKPATTPTTPVVDTGATTTTETSPKPKQDTKKSDSLSEAYKLGVHFGDPGEPKQRTLLSLTPLPSPEDTFLVFLGVQDSGKTAVFLVSTDAKATGDGNCVPSETSCDKIELRKGETELFDVSDGTGSAVKQYELRIDSIKKR
jgi:hypothetical protein